MARTKAAENYRISTSRDGIFSPHISKNTTERLTKYCKSMNINKTKFVEECINKQLNALEREYYESLSKEELINLIIK